MPKVLVTGGCGFIGSHLVEHLLRDGNEVVVVDNLSSSSRSNLKSVEPKPLLLELDIRNANALAHAMKEAETVVHLAAVVSVQESVEDPARCHDVNLSGSLNVLEAARACGVKRVVLASSSAVYGTHPASPKTEDLPLQPESPYAVHKASMELYARMYSELYGLETVCLRYFNVYGPRQNPHSPYSGVIARFAHQLTHDQTPVIFGDGEQTRDFVFVADVIRATILAMRAPKVGRGEVVNVGSGSSVSVLELLRTLKNITGSRVEPVFEPVRSGDVRHSQASIELAAALLDYVPSCSLTHGLRYLVSAGGTSPES